MSTNSFWTPENIKAIGGLWELALVLLLILMLLTVVIFFRPHARALLDRLQHLVFKHGKTEISINQPLPPLPRAEEPAKGQEASPGSEKKDGKAADVAAPNSQPEPNLDAETKVFFHFFMGELDKAEEAFQNLQTQTKEPEQRIRQEAYYLKMRFEKGDETAQKKLQAVEVRAKEFPQILGYVKRMDALCYAFSGDHSKAVERFRDSAKSCVTDSGRASSISGAADSLYELGSKSEAFALLKEELDALGEPEAKIVIYRAMAELFGKDTNKFGRALALQRALSLQPNSKDLNFDAGYACSEADLEGLAVLHYEKLIQIDHKHSSALNNLGVAFGRLEAPVLAVRYYKQAIDLGETLPAANFAQILIDAGAVNEAAKVLKEAQSHEKVHENVNHALVRLDTVRKEQEDKRTKTLESAKRQQQFLLGYADALLAPEKVKLAPTGSWVDAQAKPVQVTIYEANQTLEIEWAREHPPSLLEPSTERFKFKGRLDHFVADGEVAKFRPPLIPFSLTKDEGKFEKYAVGKAYFSRNSNSLHIMVEEEKGKEHQLLSFSKIA